MLQKNRCGMGLGLFRAGNSTAPARSALGKTNGVIYAEKSVRIRNSIFLSVSYPKCVFQHMVFECFWWFKYDTSMLNCSVHRICFSSSYLQLTTSLFTLRLPRPSGFAERASPMKSTATTVPGSCRSKFFHGVDAARFPASLNTWMRQMFVSALCQKEGLFHVRRWHIKLWPHQSLRCA